MFGDARDKMDPNKVKIPCTMPPRQREGQPHPGGRQLRKAMRRLSARQKAFVPFMPNAKKTKCTMPGSRKV